MNIMFRVMRHQIDWQDCEKQLRDHPMRSELASSFGEGSRKSIHIVTAYNPPACSFVIEVTDHGKTMYRGVDLRVAIEVFNVLD